MKRLLYLAVLILALTSCRSTPQPVTPVHSETSSTDNGKYHEQTSERRDSVIVRDSIVVKIKNDTTYIERWHEKTKDRVVYQTKTDSIYCFSVDSVYVEKPIYIERNLTLWEKTKRSFGLSIIWLLLTIAGYLVYKSCK